MSTTVPKTRFQQLWGFIKNRWKLFDHERFLVGVLFVVLNILGPSIVADVLLKSSDPKINTLMDPTLVPSLQEGVRSLNDLVVQLFTMYIGLIGIITQSLYYSWLPSQSKVTRTSFLVSVIVSIILLVFVFTGGWVTREVKLEPYMFTTRQPLPILGIYMPPWESPITPIRYGFAVWALLLGVIAGLGSQRTRNSTRRRPVRRITP